MAERDLRRYKRQELIELLYESERRNADLARSLQLEQAANQKLQELLKQRKLDVEATGNLAEAAIKVNGVFEAAQQTAEDYLENIKQRFADQEKLFAERDEKSRVAAAARLKVAARECEALQKKAEEECWCLEEETRQKCDLIKQQARKEVEAYWSELSDRMEAFYNAHEGMREIMKFYNMTLPKE